MRGVIDNETMSEAVNRAQNEAEEEAGFYGCEAITLVVAPDGAYRVAFAKGIDVNQAIGVLFRAAQSIAAQKDKGLR